MAFRVYIIGFDEEVFALFASREAADADLARQIAEGGPAWDGCRVESWLIEGEPELTNQSDRPA